MQDQIQDTINAYGVKLDATFLPASSFDDEWRSKSINHAITLTRGGRCIQAIYSQGVAHQPHYKQGDNSVNHHRAMELSIEKGNAYRPRDMDRSMQFAKALPNPSVVDVLWSLLMDSNGELSDFADFCGELGYETDSIKAKETFEACRDIKLKLQAMFTSAEIDELNELYQDF